MCLFLGWLSSAAAGVHLFQHCTIRRARPPTGHGTRASRRRESQEPLDAAEEPQPTQLGGAPGVSRVSGQLRSLQLGPLRRHRCPSTTRAGCIGAGFPRPRTSAVLPWREPQRQEDWPPQPPVDSERSPDGADATNGQSQRMPPTSSSVRLAGVLCVTGRGGCQEVPQRAAGARAHRA